MVAPVLRVLFFWNEHWSDTTNLFVYVKHYHIHGMMHIHYSLSEFQVVNQHFLTEAGLWNIDMKQQLIAHNGSIQVHPTYAQGMVHVILV